jgi:DNA-binding GntR family transcriptional regulator
VQPRGGKETAVDSLDATTHMKVLPITVTGQAVSKLRAAILNGVFKPGERLLEQNLCEWMGVSRTSVREALRRLEAERLITITPNRGPSVTEIAWNEAKAIYEVRALMEGEAAALFATRASAEDLCRLELALRAFERAVAADASLDRLAATERFYSVILEGCGNPVIGELIQGLVARITFLRARSMSRSGRSRQSA